MRHLTEAEYDALVQRAKANDINDVVDVLFAARRLAADARRVGAVLTIEQRPLQPLAMGHHEDVVEVREVRHAPR